MSPRKPPTSRQWKEKATRLHSVLVRARGVCAGCGERDYTRLQCCHIVSRRYSATRTDLANAVCGCATCHLRWTEWPLEFAAFVTAHIGAEAYQALRAKAESGSKVDWQAEHARLRELAQTQGLAA